MEVANLYAKRSLCRRGQVGAVIARQGRIIATGYNEVPANMPHCLEVGCNTLIPCTQTIHAEQNALLFSARHGIELNGASLYCTTAPCYHCAMSLVAAGITEVTYTGDYRDSAGIDYLLKANIILWKYNTQTTKSFQIERK